MSIFSYENLQTQSKFLVKFCKCLLHLQNFHMKFAEFEQFLVKFCKLSNFAFSHKLLLPFFNFRISQLYEFCKNLQISPFTFLTLSGHHPSPGTIHSPQRPGSRTKNAHRGSAVGSPSRYLRGEFGTARFFNLIKKLA